MEENTTKILTATIQTKKRNTVWRTVKSKSIGMLKLWLLQNCKAHQRGFIAESIVDNASGIVVAEKMLFCVEGAKSFPKVIYDENKQ